MRSLVSWNRGAAKTWTQQDDQRESTPEELLQAELVLPSSDFKHLCRRRETKGRHQEHTHMARGYRNSQYTPIMWSRSEL